METYLVVNPDGSTEIIQCKKGDLYDHIVRTVGSPFDVASIMPEANAYVRDNGLFDGSEPNVPFNVVTGLPIVGPMLWWSTIDSVGDTLGIDIGSPFFHTLLQAARNWQEAQEGIANNRETPFTIVGMTSFSTEDDHG